MDTNETTRYSFVENPDKLLGYWIFPCTHCCDEDSISKMGLYFDCEDVKYGHNRHVWKYQTEGRLDIYKWNSFDGGRWVKVEGDFHWNLSERQAEGHIRTKSYLEIMRMDSVCLHGYIYDLEYWNTGFYSEDWYSDQTGQECWEYIDSGDWVKNSCDI